METGEMMFAQGNSDQEIDGYPSLSAMDVSDHSFIKNMKMWMDCILKY